MPTHTWMPRRAALGWMGAGLASVIVPARLALAANSTDSNGQRLVVVMLRGALDGLAAVPALGDPAWAALRGQEAATADAPAPLGLSGGVFALHPALKHLHAWWNERQLLVMHAIASPYRERSHFDAQQLLESGGQRPFELQTGWLGRALQAAGKPAVAISSAMPVALRGSDQASTWTPSRANAGDADLVTRIGRLYGGDKQLAGVWAQALAQQGMASEVGSQGMGAGQANDFAALSQQAGRFLSAERGARVAWLESGGWDTHSQQVNRLQRQLSSLDAGLQALRESLGSHWAQTTVLVMTEFGRTATLNGSGGTDHGSGGVAFLAGGAVAGGRVLADWPGLAPTQLLEGRDLRPTMDIRTVIGAVLQRQFGFSKTQLQTGVLPDAESAERLGLWRV